MLVRAPTLPALRTSLLRTLIGPMAAIMLLASAAASAGVNTSEAAFTILELAPGVFVHLGQQRALDAVGHDDIANIGFILGKRCVAVIDSGGSMRIGRAVFGT